MFPKWTLRVVALVGTCSDDVMIVGTRAVLVVR